MHFIIIIMNTCHYHHYHLILDFCDRDNNILTYISDNRNVGLNTAAVDQVGCYDSEQLGTSDLAE